MMKSRLLRRALLALGAATLLTPLMGSANGAAPDLAPRIYGGNPVPGSPYAVALSIFDGRLWSGICSAAMWRPRVLITNAHCVTTTGSTANAAGFTVFPPGATTIRFADYLEGQAPVNVVGVVIAPGYVNSSQAVEPNDIAVLILDADLAPGAFTRLATREEATRWAAQNAPVEHVGYGLTGPGALPQVPFSVTLPLLRYQQITPLGSTFRTAQSQTQGICPGDSGSPALVTNELGPLLLGVIAGGSGPCIPGSRGNPANVGFVAIDYLNTLNQGLSAAGYVPIPGAPQNIALQARNRDVVVRWEVPVISPGTVVDYHVIDPTGAVICTSATTSCTVSNLADGQYGFTVRARNADNEGNANPIQVETAVRISPPQQMQPPTVRRTPSGAPRVTFNTSIGDSSAVVTGYVVRDNRNKVVCRVSANPPEKAEPATRTCTPKLTKSGTYRFRVQALTEMGNSPASGSSKAIQVKPPSSPPTQRPSRPAPPSPPTPTPKPEADIS